MYRAPRRNDMPFWRMPLDCAKSGQCRRTIATNGRIVASKFAGHSMLCPYGEARQIAVIREKFCGEKAFDNLRRSGRINACR